MLAAISSLGASQLTLSFGLAAACVIGLGVVHRETLRRVLLGTVDPRPLALFRVAFGCCLALNLAEIWPLATYLFSDEGLLPRAIVPARMGRDALVGFGDGVHEPAGLLGAEAALRFVTSGRWSLLYFEDSPGFVRLYLGACLVAVVGLVVGFKTRASAALAWLLYAGLLRRGDAHWGGEQVFCALLFLLLLSRSGAALSVDNWRRCRRLRRHGFLSMSSGPGGGAGMAPGPAAPGGLAAIYRRIPAWPQALIAAQLALCYAVNGWAKTGVAWARGDALLYTLLRDTHVRWDMHAVAAALGPGPLQLATWGVLWWERLFPLVLVGLWLRAAARAGAPELPAAARRTTRALWAMLAVAVALAACVPEDLVEAPGTPGAQGRAWALGLVAVAAAGLALAGARARGPLQRLASGPLAPRWWLGFGLMFHLLNHALLSVGAFALATLSAYLVCGAGPGAIRLLQRVCRRLGRWGIPVPEHLRAATAVPLEDPRLPHLDQDAAALPGWALACAGGLVLAGGAIALTVGVGRPVWWWHGAWLTAGTGLLVVGQRVARRRGGEAAAVSQPWAYGPAGRLAAGGLATYHLVALLLWQVPPWPSLPWRDSARSLVEPWLELSYTRQLWGMFAPNPPRTNSALRTVIVDAAGARHDLRTELQHPENLPRPTIWHDRGRKIDENVLGRRSWITRWHARHLCRQWALEHAGEVPRQVVLEHLQAPLPPPQARDPRAHFWQHAEARPLVHVTCADEPFARLADAVRVRHGLTPDSGERPRWPAERPAMWAERRQHQDPLAPCWPLAGLGLVAALAAWAREDRRRRAVIARQLRAAKSSMS